MPVSVDIQADKQSLVDLQTVVARLQKETGRSAEQSVIYAGLKIAESGRAASKLGKKNHASIDNPDWKQAKGSFAWAKKQRRMGKAIPAEAEAALNDLSSITPFLIVKERQNKQPFMIPSYTKKDPRRLIQRRGLAKKIWNVMVGKMGAMKTGGTGSSGKDFRVSKYTERLGEAAGSVVVRLQNKLTYLEKAYPGITTSAIQKGTARLKKTLDDRIAAATRRANRGK